MKKNIYLYVLFVLINLNCSNESSRIFENTNSEDLEQIIPPEQEELEEDIKQTPKTFKILSLGDSYTIGQSVCETCRFPEQLKRNLENKFPKSTSFNLKIIAQTGWTTSALIEAINRQNLDTNFDLVTLLIGVNNEFQGQSFSVYEFEFKRLVNTAVRLANGQKERVIIISIPDYSFTPFGRGNTTISKGIEKYNDFARSYCESIEMNYVFITDITREGLRNTDLVASDGLHPSELAYSLFVERLSPIALNILTY